MVEGVQDRERWEERREGVGLTLLEREERREKAQFRENARYSNNTL